MFGNNDADRIVVVFVPLAVFVAVISPKSIHDRTTTAILGPYPLEINVPIAT